MKLLFKKINGWKLPLLALISIVFAAISVFSKHHVIAKEPLVAPPKAIYENNVAGIGIVEPRNEMIAVGTEISGVVRQVFVAVGQKVKKDSPLFVLDQRDVNAEIMQLEADLKSADIQNKDAMDKFKLVANIGDKRAISKDEYNSRKYAAELSKANINAIKTRLNRAKTTKDRLVVKSPIDGTVLEINIRIGEFASNSQTHPLVRMGDISTLHVRVEFDEENLVHFSGNNQASGYIRGNTLKTYNLTFVRVEPYILPKQNLAVSGQRVDTRVIRAIYALPQNVGNLLVGQQMDVYVKNEGK